MPNATLSTAQTTTTRCVHSHMLARYRKTPTVFFLCEIESKGRLPSNDSIVMVSHHRRFVTRGRKNHQPVQVLEAVVLVVGPVFEVSQLTAHSAASSFALLRFLPSYQNRALKTFPCTVTRLDQAVLPPRRSETIWNTGGSICASRHNSSSLSCHGVGPLVLPDGDVLILVARQTVGNAEWEIYHQSVERKRL